MGAPLLEVRGLRVAYGGIQAVKGIDLHVGRGELVALIGANGAGKTTTLKALTGTLPRTRAEGRIDYAGQAVGGLRPSELVRRGLVMVPEGRGMFTRMTVRENLLMGAFTRSDRRGIEDDIEKWFAIFPRLRERQAQTAGTLSGGEQQMLAMARALMSQPELLLLDEPSMGLSPIMVDKIFDVIRDIAAQGMTILLVEQNAKLALEIACRGYVMDSGVVTMAGDAREMLGDPRIRVAYLGEE